MAERVAAMGNVAGVAGELLPGAFQVCNLANALGLVFMSCWMDMAQAVHAHAPEQQRASAAALLGHAERLAGRYADAEALFRQALEAYELRMGKENPDTLTSISSMAICVTAQGRHADAEALHRQALEARRRVLGEEHPDTLSSINNLALCVTAQGRHADAEALYRQALEARRRVLGEEQPSTLATAKVLKSCQEKLKAA